MHSVTAMSTTAKLSALLLSLVGLSGLAGCAGAGEPADATGQSTAAVNMSTADARLVLDLVNYPGTGRALLDGQVGLDSRAAEGIVTHRDGADGLSPSADDDLFGDLAELDAVAYVGDSAIAKLQVWAQAHPVPAGESVEGVAFAGWEAEAVIWGVNGASVAELDEVVGLDARAATNLVGSAPYASVAGMGPLGYVGPSALEQLRAHAAMWWGQMNGAADEGLGGTFDGVSFDDASAAVAVAIANLASFDQLVDHGLWSQGANAIVAARPHADLAHVAAVSGVGTATMQALHDYAASGNWPPPAEECSTVLSARSDANAADLDALLHEATMGDWPYMEVLALQVPACVNMGDAGARDGVIDEIIANHVIGWAAGPSAWQYMSGDDFERGSALFVSRADDAKQAIEDAVEGSYVPETAANAERLARLDAIHAALTDGPRTAPQAYWLATLRINAAECSEDAAMLLDPTTNAIWIIHRFPRC